MYQYIYTNIFKYVYVYIVYDDEVPLAGALDGALRSEGACCVCPESYITEYALVYEDKTPLAEYF